VQHQLEEAFQRCGVPEEMLMDHGSPWWATYLRWAIHTCPLWLMRQGIRLLGFVFAIRKRKARSSDFTDPCSEHWSEEEFRSKICKPGSTITDGAQSRATTRSAQHENTGKHLEPEAATLRSSSTTMGISVGCKGFESEC